MRLVERASFSFVLCSMLDAEGLSEGEALDDRKYNIGDKVNVFVEKVSGVEVQQHSWFHGF